MGLREVNHALDEQGQRQGVPQPLKTDTQMDRKTERQTKKRVGQFGEGVREMEGGDRRV